MKLPRNKYTLFAAAWFVLLWAALLRENGGHTPPPFPHFDKAAHCAAFFAQFWLAARAWLEDGRRPPYLPLAAAALILAAATETAQAWLRRPARRIGRPCRHRPRAVARAAGLPQPARYVKQAV